MLSTDKTGVIKWPS